MCAVGRYTFRPYDEASVASSDASRSKRDALVVSVQACVENCGSRRLRAAEAAAGRAAEALLAPPALALLDAEPELRADLVLAAGAAHQAYAALAADIGFKVRTSSTSLATHL